jgi:hypothetical protein
MLPLKPDELKPDVNVATNLGLDNAREFVSVKDFGAVGDGVADDTAKIQAGINFAQRRGVDLYVPSGRYKITGQLVINANNFDGRADTFRIYGEGPGTVWFNWEQMLNTVIVTGANQPIFKQAHDKRAQPGAGSLIIEQMFLEQTNAAATAPLIDLDFVGHRSAFRYLGGRQAGRGDGIWQRDTNGDVLYEYIDLGNRDLATEKPPQGRVGTGLRLESQGMAGCLVTVRKVRNRGWLCCLRFGKSGGAIAINWRAEQVECSMFGGRGGGGVIISDTCIGANLVDLFCEGMEGTGIVDAGVGTIVDNGFFFAYGVTAIDSTVAGYGNLYRANKIYLKGLGSVGIDIYTRADGQGARKSAPNNFIYDQGGPGVTGIRMRTASSSATTSLDLHGTVFRPEGPWAGAGSRKVEYAGARNIGELAIANASGHYPYHSEVNLSLARMPGYIDKAAVAGGVVTLGPWAYYEIDQTPSISRIAVPEDLPQTPREIVLRLHGPARIEKNSQMVIGSDIAGPGMLTLYIEKVNGIWYAIGKSWMQH